LLGNYGLAIIAITICIRLAFFPLANFSFRSMAKMKALQPEMVRLKELHKDDKMKLQQEMMALYKKEKVNPMSGCLPILVQIPVFFALYKVLFVTIEMRQMPFYGWIQDLSERDPTSVFNLFGLFALRCSILFNDWCVAYCNGCINVYSTKTKPCSNRSYAG
jgi:YidC/Oxa1 family membrane protein insertase